MFCPAGLLTPSLPNAAGHSLEARCSLTTSDMIYISMAHFTLMDAKGHFKPSFAEKFLYLGCDKTLQHIKRHTVALWQAAKMSIRGSCKGTFGGVNTISHFCSVWNTRTSIFPILTKTGIEVLTVTRLFFFCFFFFISEGMSWSQNHTEKLELVVNQKEMSSTYGVSPHHDLS